MAESRKSEPELIGPIAERVLNDIQRRVRNKSENTENCEQVKIRTNDGINEENDIRNYKNNDAN